MDVPVFPLICPCFNLSFISVDVLFYDPVLCFILFYSVLFCFITLPSFFYLFVKFPLATHSGIVDNSLAVKATGSNFN